MSFHLQWRQHGGSGLGRTYTEMLEMPVDRILRDVERVNVRRREEVRRLAGKK